MFLSGLPLWDNITIAGVMVILSMLWPIGYNLVLIGGVVLLAPLWLIWLALVPKTRAGFWEKLGHFRAEVAQKLEALPSTKNRIWIHTVSVGEFQAAKPLIQALKARGYPLVLSTTTATGQVLARQTFADLPVCYFPFDLPWVVSGVIRRIQPSLIVILETEIWPNLLWMAQKKRVPVLMVNGRLSPRSFSGYCRLKPFFQAVLNQYHRLLMQSEGDKDRMVALGVDPGKVETVGNIKFDIAPPAQSELHAQIRQLFAFPEGAPVVVFASSHGTEEEKFIAIYTELTASLPTLRAVFVPRHPERFDEVAQLLTNRGVTFTRRSQLTPASPNSAAVVLLDSIGELNALYTLGTVACMGGSFAPIGGHNPLEPINASIPVVFGPHMENFQEIARRVVESQSGFQVDGATQAGKTLLALLTDRALYEQTVKNGQALMAANRGVTQKLVETLERTLQD